MPSPRTAMAGLCVAFSSVTASAAPLGDLAREAQAMAHELIRAAQDTAGQQAQREGRMRELIRQDPTILYGNHAGSLAAWGADSNVVLARHYTVPQSLQGCSHAMEPGLSDAQKIDMISGCIGNMREMGHFGIVTVDQEKLQDLRSRLIALRP